MLVMVDEEEARRSISKPSPSIPDRPFSMPAVAPAAVSAVAHASGCGLAGEMGEEEERVLVMVDEEEARRSIPKKRKGSPSSVAVTKNTKKPKKKKDGGAQKQRVAMSMDLLGNQSP